MPLTDGEIDGLDVAARLALIRRLRRGAVVDRALLDAERRVRRRRAVALTVTAVAAALLVPWTAYLAVSLPDQYVANAWALTWVGFDVLLIVLLGLTAFFAWKRRMLVVLTSFATGVLLLVDVWFDITTSDADDLHLSVASAVLVEIPLAVFLMVMSIGISWKLSGLLNALTGSSGVGRWRMPISAEIVADAVDTGEPAPTEG
ncbi:hypothetical protein GCM10011492_16050 [Flexivirga endophytica]|uniref:Uncharacterized protein n=1 Tax=Flexivirga endophytica TaxID=1849103 RepID=A0A916T1Z0_9MICO|nr:hypothetical protein [Flexivirga endophytica]GGB26598.1 hypothetical protein GCM10011492_16050 [Flexivirga endophytica]GHB55087.1 hypothetical protein GCM10008112_25360 [Flexivirga endophytica]